ncbi:MULTISPECIES: 4-hydroxy-tetrahydrodipicolinate synthase [unclassified Marinobacter]|uniref:4-hydroxy-tetrahydrodipicolinate synthase n=1 Tax=unclassified Marinobacter TaxID=83889 RepID=UPI0008DE3340|nr:MULTISPECIES: 4-hydroxy-tetrahydrodipicolinate synthase [unclassified Marinobacter]MBQ0831362.1 4-hydroxy-tetrahydrodipicolinate synthase [Marinobacter sp.]OHY82127.1 4-hydroxy-tetrahydrodipicolinate synthase [Marinobacter sp. AC-23]
MITGSLVALVTPMHPNGDIHWEDLDKLVDFHLENGTNGIVAVGTTGESATLDQKEHCRVIGYIIKRVNGRIPVIAGTGGNSTREAIHLTTEAHKLGADACLLVVPYYNKPTQEGLYQHFKTIAEAVPGISQMLYNVPGRTACDMLNDTVLRLADIPNIVAIKDATGNIPRGAELIQALDGRLAVYSGDDATAAELMLAGGQGNVSVTANVAPKGMSDLCAAAIAGNREETERLNELLMPLNRKLFLEANPIPVKWALQRMDMIGGGIRLPLTPFSEKFHAEVEEAMKVSGVL